MARTTDGVPVGPSNFQEVAIYGGGYMAGIQLSDDGLTKVICSDTFNSYVWGPDDDRFRAFFTSTSMPAGDFDPYPANPTLYDEPGGFGAAVAPTDNQYLIGGHKGFFYFSTDCGNTFVRGNLSAKRMKTNSTGSRIWLGNAIAISPGNKNHAILGTSGDGVYYTTDFGATITQISGLTSAVWDPFICKISENGNDCYIAVQTVGIYHSSTGVGGPYSLMSGSPIQVSCIDIDSNGNLYISTGTTSGWSPDGNGPPRRYTVANTTWTDCALSAGYSPPPISIAVNPDDPNHLVYINTDGVTIQSMDGGSTIMSGEYWGSNWPSGGGWSFANGDVSWLNQPRGYGMNPAQIRFNKAANNELWMAYGVGIAKSNPPTTWVPWVWEPVSLGIRQLVTTEILSVPGVPGPIISVMDRGTFNVNDNPINELLAPQYYIANQTGLEHSWQCDYAIDDHNYIVDARDPNGGSKYGGLSTDGGLTWGKLWPAGMPTALSGRTGGAVAVSTKLQQIYIPGNNARAICTEDGWATWDYLPIDDAGGWINAYFTRRRLVCADKERPGVFACVVKSTQTAGQGIHVTTTGPLGTWSRTVAGRIDTVPYGDSADFWHCRLSYIPGKPGELLYTAGRDFDSRLLWFTEDGAGQSRVALGSAWTLDRVYDFGFGKAAPGQSYPCIYFYGRMDGVYGLYRSHDFFATEPTLLSSYPLYSLDAFNTVEGDMNIYGRVYIGGPGATVVYADYADTRTQS